MSLYYESTNMFWKYFITMPAKCLFVNQLVSLFISTVLSADAFVFELSSQMPNSANSHINVNTKTIGTDLIATRSSSRNSMFRNEKYSTVPTSASFVALDLPETEQFYNQDTSYVKTSSNKRKRRQKRHNRNVNHRHRHAGLTHRSCKTRSKYGYKDRAINMFGDIVQVYPYIHIGSLSIDQYFFETFCDEERCECSGIDSEKFRSSCETDYTFTYARVVKNGEVGWSHIKIRSGCSCKIHKVASSRHVNIVDVI